PAQEQAEVVAGRGEHGVGTIALTPLEIVSIHAVFGLYVADDRLDGRSSFHLAPDGRGDPSRLAADPDPELVRVVMAAIALVDVDTVRLDAEELRHLSDGRAERMAI